jgi:hypothetical protein
MCIIENGQIIGSGSRLIHSRDRISAVLTRIFH